MRGGSGVRLAVWEGLFSAGTGRPVVVLCVQGGEGLDFERCLALCFTQGRAICQQLFMYVLIEILFLLDLKKSVGLRMAGYCF